MVERFTVQASGVWGFSVQGVILMITFTIVVYIISIVSTIVFLLLLWL